MENVDRILYTLDLAVRKRGRVMKHDLDKVSKHAKAPYSDQLIVKLLAYSIIPQSTHPQLKIHSFIKNISFIIHNLICLEWVPISLAVFSLFEAYFLLSIWGCHVKANRVKYNSFINKIIHSFTKNLLFILKYNSFIHKIKFIKLFKE